MHSGCHHHVRRSALPLQANKPMLQPTTTTTRQSYNEHQVNERNRQAISQHAHSVHAQKHLTVSLLPLFLPLQPRRICVLCYDSPLTHKRAKSLRLGRSPILSPSKNMGAYRLTLEDRTDSLLFGLPAWVKTTRYLPTPSLTPPTCPSVNSFVPSAFFLRCPRDMQHPSVAKM